MTGSIDMPPVEIDFCLDFFFSFLNISETGSIFFVEKKPSALCKVLGYNVSFKLLENLL